MSVKKIPIIKPYFTKAEEQAVIQVLRSGWLVQGPNVEEFEKKIAKYVGVKYAVVTSSCTTALHVALLSLGIGVGDEVIVPSFSFVATPNCVRFTGAIPVFADVKNNTMNVDPVDIEKKITKKTKVIMPVHQVGLAADMPSIMKIARKYKLLVVEDVACGLGATIKNKMVGSFGIIGCLSFHPRKSITTGEGGMILTNDSGIAKMARVLRSHGMSVSDRIRHESKTFVNETYDVLGYNYRMSDIHAAIGVIQFKKLKKILAKRIMLAERYNKKFFKNPYLETPIQPYNYKHTYQSYVIKLSKNSPVSRKEFMSALLDKGISTRIGIKASHLEKLYKHQNIYPPNTELLAKTIVTIPLYYEMTQKEQDYVIEGVLEILKYK